SLAQALRDLSDWNVQRITEAAFRAAQEMDDVSLVGLAARARDSVVLAALRESVVLVAEVVLTGLLEVAPVREFIWKVDDDLAQQASRLVGVFNGLFGDQLPPPDARHAESFWRGNNDVVIRGRCARLASDPKTGRHYHWGIR